MSRHLLLAGGANRPLPYVPVANATGISVFEVDTESGGWRLLGAVADIDNPTYLSLSPDGRSVVATSEIFGRDEGLATLFALDRETGQLDYVNMQPTRGDIAAHSAFDSTGRLVAVANYGTLSAAARPNRSLVVYPITATGGLGPVLAETTLPGQVGPNAARQDRSHAHCVRWVADTRMLLTVDLGLDRVFSHLLDPRRGELLPRNEVALAPGSGPRHIEMHSTRPLAYVVGELNATVATLGYDPVEGRPSLLGVSAIAGGSGGCSAVRLSPDGRQLYVGDRDRHAIARFDIDPVTGVAHYAASMPSGGRTPRDFAFSPDGRMLAIGNQDSDEIALLRVDAGTGSLSPLGAPIACGTPMSVLFVP